MKKTLPLSKIPNDIKYRLGLVATRVEDIGILLASLDPAAWPGGEHSALTDSLATVALRLAAVQAARPRKRTEEVPAVEAAQVPVEVAPVAPVDAAPLPTLDEAVEAVEAEEAAPVEAAPEVDVLAARRERKRERDRLSAARRRADRLDARAEVQP